MIKFDSVEEVYSSKTKKELYKSYFLFRLIKSSFITYTLTKILKISLFLRLPINSIIKSTVYEQFCGGVSIPDSEKVINTLLCFLPIDLLQALFSHLSLLTQLEINIQ